MRWPWRRRKDRPVTDASERERFGKPDAMRCRWCSGSRTTRFVRDRATGVIHLIRYCPKCDHINRRN